MANPTTRVPVRASFAIAGGGSLGTFLAGALRTLLRAIWRHNAAVGRGETVHADLLRPDWGHITIDSIGGSSAGALCASQLARALFEPEYAGAELPLTEPHTLTGDWIHGAELTRLAVEANDPARSGSIEAPGWTVLSGARLHELSSRALMADAPPSDPLPPSASPLDPSGLVAIGITLTDLLGYHEPAEFSVERVVGHPSFGAVEPSASRQQQRAGEQIRDLGGRGHAETRKLFLARDSDGAELARRFLTETRRRGRARALAWNEASAEHLAALTAASAALPLAVGPLALTDQNADVSVSSRRLYVDGGILNNKPVAPALKLGRWHDGSRLLGLRDPETGALPLDAIERELVYTRVCFFIDAFPDRAMGEWRSPHPDEALRESGIWHLTRAAVEARGSRIDHALATPHSALDVLFESMMTSLRAQDLMGIAKTNQQLEARDRYIDDRCASVSHNPTSFQIDTIEKAEAYASVRLRPAGMVLTENQARKVAQRIWESDQFSGLGGRRPVTMIPVFAPLNLRGVFAGEALYSLGGLLGYDARKHDAGVGEAVATHVLSGIDPSRPVAEVTLADAPRSVVPEDTSAVVDRLMVAAAAAIDGLQPKETAVRAFAKLPLRLPFVRRLIREWLDRRVTGMPED